MPAYAAVLPDLPLSRAILVDGLEYVVAFDGHAQVVRNLRGEEVASLDVDTACEQAFYATANGETGCAPRDVYDNALCDNIENALEAARWLVGAVLHA